MAEEAYRSYYEGWVSQLRMRGEWTADESGAPLVERAFKVGFMRGVTHAKEELPKIKKTGELSELEWNLCLEGKYIQAIKEIRARTGLDLKSAKAFLDKHRPPKQQ